MVKTKHNDMLIVEGKKNRNMKVKTQLHFNVEAQILYCITSIIIKVLQVHNFTRKLTRTSVCIKE
jgi:hypothetical protein